ncbi:hypothetical protein U1437_21370, partial [Aeromonas caviae]
MHKRRLPPGSGALLVLVILIALNLRPFLTAIGPLAPRIDARLALGVDTLAWVTLLPLWLIGVGVLLTPALLGRTWLITSCRSANNIMPITFFLPAFIASSFYSA